VPIRHAVAFQNETSLTSNVARDGHNAQILAHLRGIVSSHPRFTWDFWSRLENRYPLNEPTRYSDLGPNFPGIRRLDSAKVSAAL